MCTVLLGVLDQRVNDRVFQATLERKLALLLGDALGTGRRFRRATNVGNNSVQVCVKKKLDLHVPPSAITLKKCT